MPIITLALLMLAAALFLTSAVFLLRGSLSRNALVMQLVVSRRTDHTDDCLTLILQRRGLARLLPLPAYLAGHAVALAIPGHALQRRYSLARWVRWPLSYELTIKREAQGHFSPRLADYAQPGSILNVSPPSGGFILPARPQRRRVVLIAGGVGITPLLAMLEQWLARQRGMSKTYLECHLYWQVRYDDEACYRDLLQAIGQRHPALRLRILVSRSRAGMREKLSLPLLQKELETFDDSDFFICAGNSLMASLLQGLSEYGVAKTALHVERFKLASASANEQQWTIQWAEKEILFNGPAGHRSVLDAIEAAGLPLASDCRAGSCGQCLIKIKHGHAEHLTEPEYQVPLQHVLACCAVPKSHLGIDRPSV